MAAAKKGSSLPPVCVLVEATPPNTLQEANHLASIVNELVADQGTNPADVTIGHNGGTISYSWVV